MRNQIGEKITLKELIMALNPVIKDIYSQFKTVPSINHLTLTGSSQSSEFVAFRVPEGSEVIGVTPCKSWAVQDGVLRIQKIPTLAFQRTDKLWSCELPEGVYWSKYGVVNLTKNGEYFEVTNSRVVETILTLYPVSELYTITIKGGA